MDVLGIGCKQCAKKIEQERSVFYIKGNFLGWILILGGVLCTGRVFYVDKHAGRYNSKWGYNYGVKVVCI